MSAEELAALASDIRRDGLLEKIKLWCSPDGVTFLVDGRSRLRALQSLGLKPSVEHTTVVSCKAEEIATLIVGLNVHRRMLTARQKIQLTLAAMQAGADFHPKKLVSRIATATGLSKVSVYDNRDLLPEGSYRPQGSVGPAIAQALATLPPSNDTRRGKRGGRIRQTPARVAAVTGVCLATAKKYLAQQPGNGNGHHFNSGYGKPKAPTFAEEKNLSPEDLALGRAIRCLEDVSGADLTSWGLYKLSVAEGHLARIKHEHEQETEVEHDVMAEAATS
jgi:hypothetical protein